MKEGPSQGQKARHACGNPPCHRSPRHAVPSHNNRLSPTRLQNGPGRSKWLRCCRDADSIAPEPTGSGKRLPNWFQMHTAPRRRRPARPRPPTSPDAPPPDGARARGRRRPWPGWGAPGSLRESLASHWKARPSKGHGLSGGFANPADAVLDVGLPGLGFGKAEPCLRGGQGRGADVAAETGVVMGLEVVRGDVGRSIRASRG